MHYKRKVPDRDTLAKQLETMTIDEIARAAGVGRRAVMLHLTRYKLVDCRTNAVRFAELQNRPAPPPAPRRGIAVQDDRITFTRDAHVAGRGWELRGLSLPAPKIYVAAVAAKRGGTHAGL